MGQVVPVLISPLQRLIFQIIAIIQSHNHDLSTLTVINFDVDKVKKN